MVLFLGPLYSGKHDAAKAYAKASGKDWTSLRVLDNVPWAIHADHSADLSQLADRFAEHYDLILVTEVGSGLVPVDEKKRADRETAGRLSVLLAERADEVYRVVAGLSKRLK